MNSPHNPTGVVYSERSLAELEALLSRAAEPVTVISDEPYKPLVYDGLQPPEVLRILTRVVVAHSWSKSQAISGERIGYLAISPRLPEAEELRNACTFTNRILGFINAPAIWQWVVAESGEAVVDVAQYQEKRDLICDSLLRFGYQLTKPQGTFYVFPAHAHRRRRGFRVRRLQREGILAVPGSGFGLAGYFRLSLTVPRETMERSLPGFERAIGE